MKFRCTIFLFSTISLFAGSTVKPSVALTPPSIKKPQAGEKIVEGTASASKYKVRVKVFGEAGEIQHRDALIDESDATFGAVLKEPLAAGEIVQVFLLVNGVETAPSIPMAVAASTTDGTTASSLNTHALSKADTTSGKDANSAMSSSSASDTKRATTKNAGDTGTPAKPDPCSPAPNPAGTISLGPIVLHPTLQDGATAITGTSPIATGTVVACLKGSSLTLAPKADQKVAKGAFGLTLKDGLQKGDSIDVVGVGP